MKRPTELEEVQPSARASTRLEDVMDCCPDAIWSVDRKLRVMASNQVFRRVFRVNPDVGDDVDLPDELGIALTEHYTRAFEGATFSIRQCVGSGEFRRALELSFHPVVSDGEVSMVGVVARDFSQLGALEHTVQMTDRLASIGTLAAGVAHEVNNPLMTILLHLESIRADLDAGSADTELLRKLVSESLECVDRVGETVKSLADFAAREEEGVRAVEVPTLVEGAVALIHFGDRHRVELVASLGDDLPPVEVVAPAMIRALGNILANSLEAFDDEVSENRITISASCETEDRVLIEISDNGRGIEPAELTRVLDPFFTTKSVGQGKGLGLSAAAGIVAAANGDLTIRSELGAGTVVEVRLPVAVVPEEGGGERESPASQTLRRVTGDPLRILVVDDEPLIRASIVRLLRDDDVVTASGGRAALQALEQSDYDVVLCDLLMPDMSGMTLYEEVQACRPAMARRFVFLTGAATSAEVRAFLRTVPQNQCVMKPASQATLLRALRGVFARMAG